MRTVFKYILEPLTVTSVELPAAATVIHAEMQNDALCMWAELDPEAEKVERNFAVYGTGHYIDADAKHIASVQHGPFMWHVYERGKNNG